MGSAGRRGARWSPGPTEGLPGTSEVSQEGARSCQGLPEKGPTSACRQDMGTEPVSRALGQHHPATWLPLPRQSAAGTSPSHTGHPPLSICIPQAQGPFTGLSGTAGGWAITRRCGTWSRRARDPRLQIHRTLLQYECWTVASKPWAHGVRPDSLHDAKRLGDSGWAVLAPRCITGRSVSTPRPPSPVLRAGGQAEVSGSNVGWHRNGDRQQLHEEPPDVSRSVPASKVSTLGPRSQMSPSFVQGSRNPLPHHIVP